MAARADQDGQGVMKPFQPGKDGSHVLCSFVTFHKLRFGLCA